MHDSSLSKNTHCVLACDLGFEKQAEAFFEGSCDIDLGPVMGSSDMGIHAAAMGGIWMSAVYGFGGVRLTGGELRLAPRLHSQWRSLIFPLCWRGCCLTVRATPGQVFVQNHGGNPVTLYVYGKRVTLESGRRYEKGV